MKLYARQQWRKRYKQTYGHGKKGGDGEMYVESNMESSITICKIDSQWEFPICLRKLKQGLYINLEGLDGVGKRRELQEGGAIYVHMADSC